ncbi:MAG: hypothetical protein LC799_16095 [Actinobacteria bacterium]|nr:hypothetical protein [Actinomycetota bacterium]
MNGSEQEAAAAGAAAERVLRRSLGPTAWAVLADVCLDAESDGAGIQVAAASARRVAAHLGIAKDTAARALRRLTAAGILRRRPQGASPAGQFTRGTYEVHLPGNATPGPCPPIEDTVLRPRPESADTENAPMSVAPAVATRSAPPGRRTRRTMGPSSAQLSLLERVPEVIGPDDLGRLG